MQVIPTQFYPERIVCLTEETTETLYLLEEEDRIVGISGFTARPPEARKTKPIVSTFMEAKVEEILALQPDLVIGFSDIQANIARELIANGITVWVNNHRSVQGILQMMVQLGALVGKQQEALELVAQVKHQIEDIQIEVNRWQVKPTVYFEEWYNPIISGIRWVSELISLAGGKHLFAELSQRPLAKDRIITNPAEVVAYNPDIILVSWCGKMYKEDKLITRPDWDKIKAVKNKNVIEIKSEIILQPGPAAVLEGLPLMHQLFKTWTKTYGASA